MKSLIIFYALCFCVSNGFTQDVIPKETLKIEVPGFADAGVKRFYQSYADHLIKCIKAIREKDEAKAKSLFKNPGEQMVAKEKTISKEVVKNPVEKKKYMEFAAQVYPYLKEVEQSAYYKKMYGK
jgi:hypothetical protein